MQQSARRGRASCWAGGSPGRCEKPRPQCRPLLSQRQSPAGDSWKMPFMLGPCIQNLSPVMGGCVCSSNKCQCPSSFYAVLSSAKMVTGNLTWLFFNILSGQKEKVALTKPWGEFLLIPQTLKSNGRGSSNFIPGDVPSYSSSLLS